MFSPKILSAIVACGSLVIALAVYAGVDNSSSSRPCPSGVKASDAVSKPFPALTRVGGCTIASRNNQMRLIGPTEGRSLVQTVTEYKPPFAFRVRAKTDSKNIRLYYNAGMIILNWEVRPSELRYHDLMNDTITAFKNKGAIESDKYYDLAWEIYPDGTRLLVDGNEVMRKAGEYGKLQAPVGIGPAFGSVVTLKSFQVNPLKGTLEEQTDAKTTDQ